MFNMTTVFLLPYPSEMNLPEQHTKEDEFKDVIPMEFDPELYDRIMDPIIKKVYQQIGELETNDDIREAGDKHANKQKKKKGKFSKNIITKNERSSKMNLQSETTRPITNTKR